MIEDEDCTETEKEDSSAPSAARPNTRHREKVATASELTSVERSKGGNMSFSFVSVCKDSVCNDFY